MSQRARCPLTGEVGSGRRPTDPSKAWKITFRWVNWRVTCPRGRVDRRQPRGRRRRSRSLDCRSASPSFTAWRAGPPLDIETLLWSGDKPRAAVVYLAHLSDDERQFVVTLLLSKLITWMRSQAGSSDLRALVYMDEVFGFVPPTMSTLPKSVSSSVVGVVSLSGIDRPLPETSISGAIPVARTVNV